MLKYRVSLINVWWSKEDINTRFFNSISEQNEYFDILVGGGWSPLTNFNIGNNIETAITYRDDSSKSINELLRCNYLVMQEIDENDEIINRRYYFAYVSQDSGRQMRVVLDLDDIQTNYFKYKNTIKDCVINRGHLSRFIDGGDTIRFDTTAKSKLFEVENNQILPKRLTKRTRITPRFTNSWLDDWFDYNVAYWVYTFIDINKAYKICDVESKELVERVLPSFTNPNSPNIPYAFVCYPEYTNHSVGKIIITYGEEKIYLEKSALEKFFENNGGTEETAPAFVYSQKISKVPPFNKYDWDNYITFDDNDNVLIDFDIYRAPDYYIRGNVSVIQSYDPGSTPSAPYVLKYGLVCQTQFESYFDTDDYTSDCELLFDKNIVNLETPRNKKYNPKLLSGRYRNIKINNAYGDNFDYDMQKIGNNVFNFRYTEIVNADITKYYLRLKPPAFCEMYSEDTMYNYLGLIGSNDTTFSVAVTQLAQFLANNKNFYLQSNVDIGLSMLSTLVGAIGGFATGGPIGAIAGGLSGVITTSKKIVDTNSTIDNLKNAPTTLKNINGSVLFNIAVQNPKGDNGGLGIYIEEYQCLDEEMQNDDDFMYMNGFVYGHLGNIADFDNIRYYFNYISADVETITAPISNLEKERLKNRLKDIRFWNSDNVQYIYENWERSLING